MRAAPLPQHGSPQRLGVDDWARRKGQTYGTIVVDLDAHRVVDLLPDRTAETLTTWLRQRPTVALVARDRSTEYTRAITAAVPAAVQVADRWHLLLNVRQMAERWLTSMHGRLRQLQPAWQRSRYPSAAYGHFGGLGPRPPRAPRTGRTGRPSTSRCSDATRRASP
jgi:transposase